MAKSQPEPSRVCLYTAVDYLYGQGAGIGIVLRAENTSRTTGMKGPTIPTQERNFSVTREQLGPENVKTAGRAEMLALVHALGLAYGTIRRLRTRVDRPQEVTVLCRSPKVVQTVNYHVKHASDSFREVASANDRSMIKRVVTSVRRLSRRGLQVSIALSCGDNEPGERAQTMARQRGRKACKSRRQLQLAHIDSSVEE